MRKHIGRIVAIGLLVMGGLGATGVPAAAASTYLNCLYATPNQSLPQLQVYSCVEHYGFPGLPVRAYGYVVNYNSVTVGVAIQVSLTGATGVYSNTCSKSLPYGYAVACSGSGWAIPNPTAKTKLIMSSFAPGQPIRVHTVLSLGQN
jgi:hypothetical protein